MHLKNSRIQIKGNGFISHFLILRIQSSQLKIQFAALFVLAAVLCGCGTTSPVKPSSNNTYEVYGKVYHPLDSAAGFRQRGVASWYGKQFHEKKTANGEIYNMHAMTAAHKTLPFGTIVKVKNVANERTTIVRINDRGPFCRDRIIDLSFSAAKEIGMIKNGTAPVEIMAMGKDDEVLTKADKTNSNTKPDNIYFTGDFTIQVGSFGDPDNAEKLKKSLGKITRDIYVIPIEKDGQTFYRVRVGRFNSLKQAQAMEQHLVQSGFKNVYTVAWDL